MLVCLDAGHGKETAGKRSFDSTLLEYEFNRYVANRLESYLQRADIKVVKTVHTEKDVSLADRVKAANTAKADLFISIHANAAGTTWNEIRGWEIFVHKKGGKAEELAKQIHKSCIPFLGLKDRGIKENAELYVLKHTKMPAVLIEFGFYTNKEEAELLKSASFREKCAIAAAHGVFRYFGIKM